MRLLIALVLVASALAYVPAVDAHSCNGTNCGPCPKGEDHAHNGPGGQCVSGMYGDAENGAGGQNASPGSGVFWTLVALVGSAFALVHARRA